MEILNIIFDTKIREDKTRDQLFCEKSKVIYTKYSKQFKWNSYFYVSG